MLLIRSREEGEEATLPRAPPSQDAAREVLLFLKSVRRVELYIKAGPDVPPRLLLSASLSLPTAQGAAAAPALQAASSLGSGSSIGEHPQQAVLRFVRGPAGSDFFQRLAGAKEGELPRACAPVTVSVAGSVPDTLGPGALSGAAESGSSTSSWAPGEAGPQQQQQEERQQWLVCSLLAGARAQRMAVEASRAPRAEGKGWVPWAGVAAPLQPPTSLVSSWPGMRLLALSLQWGYIATCARCGSCPGRKHMPLQC